MTENRELLQKYIDREDLISDEKVELLYSLITLDWPSKNDILKISGFDVSKNYDTAYPEPYADEIRARYPDFNNGSYIYDYSHDPCFGRMVNIYNLFAKAIIKNKDIYKTLIP